MNNKKNSLFLKKNPLKRKLITTEDGSKSLFISDLNETYHSRHGALQEAEHVFIKNGINKINNCDINIFELGFGTGLNLLVTIDDYLKNDKNHIINYFGVEKYPITVEEAQELCYKHHFDHQLIKDLSIEIHQSKWDIKNELFDHFFLTKFRKDFYEIKNLDLPAIDLVYFDCFGSQVQPDLWERNLIEIVADKIKSGGLFTTYSSKGSVRRILIELGFDVEKVPGPPGKREMINAWKK